MAFLAPWDATATAIFGALAQASLEFVGIDHAGGGNGVQVQSAYEPDPTFSGEEGDVFAIAFSEAFLEEGRVELSSRSFGEALDGSGFSSTGISAWFDIFNDSSAELTAHFSVTWLLEAEGLVDSGFARAWGGIHVLSTADENPFFDSVGLMMGPGFETRHSEITREFSMVVPPHEGHLFVVSLSAEGSSSAGSHEVPEPIAAPLLAVGLAAAVIAGARRRLS